MFDVLEILFKESLELLEFAEGLDLEIGTLFFNTADHGISLFDIARCVFLEEIGLSSLSSDGICLVNVGENFLNRCSEIFDYSLTFFFPEFAVLFLKSEIVSVVILVCADGEYDSLGDEESDND